jgi:hypothetical protein
VESSERVPPLAKDIDDIRGHAAEECHAKQLNWRCASVTVAVDHERGVPAGGPELEVGVPDELDMKRLRARHRARL